MSDDDMMPPPVVTHSPAPLRKQPRATWLLLLLIPLSIVAVVLLIVGAGVVFVLTAVEQEVTLEDRKLVVDINALADCLEEYVPDPDHETITKRRYVDRSFEIEYQYDDPADDKEPYLSCTVSVELTSSDARASYLALWDSTKLGMSLFGDAEVEVVERNDLFRWGDHSRFGIIKSGGLPRGNLFVARKDRFVFHLVVVGVYFEDSEAFADLVMPALLHIESYRP